ncbi:tape measure protein [Inquilinus sp. OTU3971]|uniref:tape measure protein n=1 Tax=Inquilinus sp. OTU3971 TaxID=3043855 RepID=UPI00313C1A7E
MATAGQIRVELELDDGRFTQRIVRAGSTVQQFERQLKGTIVGVDRIDNQFKGFGQTARDVTLTLGLAGYAIQNIHAITTGWMYGIVKANAEIERMTFLLKGMSEQNSEAAQELEAKNQLGWIFDTAREAPFAVASITDSFVKMKSVGIDPMDGSMNSLLDAVAAFGGSDQQFQRASLAIQQMGGKGVISMEELRQQLGEAVPNAVALMARSAGMSYGAFVKLVSKGAVEAEDALTRMFGEFDRVYGGRAQAMMGTWNGLVAQASTNWTQLLTSTEEGGFFTEAKTQLQAIVDLLRTPDAKAFMVDLGSGLTQVLQAGRGVVDFFLEWRGAIVTAGEAFLLYFAVSRSIQVFRSIGTAIEGVRSGFVAFGMSMQIMRGQMAAMQGQAVTAAGAVTTVGTATASATTVMGRAAMAAGVLGRGIALLAGPIGAVAALLWTLSDQLDLFGAKAERIRNIADKGSLFISEVQLNEAKDRLNELWTQREDLAAKQEALEKRVPMTRWEQTYYKETQLPAVKKEREAVEAEFNKLNAAYLKSVDVFRKNEIAEAASGQLRSLDADLAKTSGAYSERMNALDDAYKADLQKAGDNEAEKDRVEKQYQDQRISEISDFYKQQEAIVAAMIASYSAQQATAIGQDAAVIEVVLGRLNEQLQQIRQQAAGQIALAGKPLVTVIPPGGGGGKSKSPFESETERLNQRLAEANYLLQGMDKNAARLRSRFDAGLLGKISEEQLQGLIDKANELDEVEDHVKQVTSAIDKLKNTVRELNREGEGQRIRLLQGLDNEIDPKGLAQFRTEMNQLVADAGEFGAGTSEQIDQARNNVKQWINNYVRDWAIGADAATREIEDSLLTEDELREKNYQREVDRINRLLQLQTLNSDERVVLEQKTAAYLDALRRKKERDDEGAVGDLLRKWSDATSQMKDAQADWLQSGVDELTDYVTTGEANFEDFANSIIKDILRIALQASIAKALGENIAGGGSSSGGGFLDDIIGGIGDALGGAFNWAFGSTGSTASTGTIDVKPLAPIAKNHTGGIVGAENMFSLDDILKSNEVHAILEKGEGVFTAEQMKALGPAGGTAINVDASGMLSGLSQEMKFLREAYEGMASAAVLQPLASVDLDAMSQGAGQLQNAGWTGYRAGDMAGYGGRPAYTNEQLSGANAGGAGQGNVQVNIINQSGTQLEAEQQGSRFDGESMILDVVVRAAARPGPFRDSLRNLK